MPDGRHRWWRALRLPDAVRPAVLSLEREGGGATRTLHYRLQRESGQWRLTDVEYGHGPAQQQLLNEAADGQR